MSKLSKNLRKHLRVVELAEDLAEEEDISLDEATDKIYQENELEKPEWLGEVNE